MFWDCYHFVTEFQIVFSLLKVPHVGFSMVQLKIELKHIEDNLSSKTLQ